MSMRLTGASVFRDGHFLSLDVLVRGGRVSFLSPDAPLDQTPLISLSDCYFLPGFADVHVHFREPGFSYKETIRTGTLAAASAGYTAVCTMPNLNPVPDSPAHLQPQLDLIRRDAVIPVYPYGAITVGQRGEALADLAGMADSVVAFSDDGRGVQSESLMRQAMEEAKRLGKLIVAHCEDNALLRGGYIHDGAYARAHSHRGICSESEWGPIARDLKLAKETGCRYHVCHVSTKESVDLIRRAKAEGVAVTCETAPHYLLLCDADLQEDGRFKMNPPLRSEADRDALRAALLDGTIDVIATDHAPHAAAEKNRGLAHSAMGVVGLETAFPVLYTGLVKPGLLPLERLISLMSTRPREIFGLPNNADYALLSVGQPYCIDPERFRSMGRATPFAGLQVYGKNLITIANGEVVWKAEN